MAGVVVGCCRGFNPLTPRFKDAHRNPYGQAKEKKRRAKAKKQQERARDAQQVGDAAAARAAAEAEAAESSGDEGERDRGRPRCDSCGKAVKVVRVCLEDVCVRVGVVWGLVACTAGGGASTGGMFLRRRDHVNL